MDSLELTTTEQLVRLHTPELIPQDDPETRIVAQISFFLIAATAAYPILLLLLTRIGIATPIAALIPTTIAGVAGAIGVGRFFRRDFQDQQERFSKELRETPWKFYEAVSLKFADEIERQRARAIGPSSEWGQARLHLESAAQEADRSRAYWTQRLATEPGNEIAQTQLNAAKQLHDKFSSALSELDQRARMLVAFFNDCEARVAVLQSTKRDFEEIQKLERLSDRSDGIVTHAQETLASIGRSFVSEALRVANALGGLERIGLANLAGGVSVEQLEILADRIVESAERDRKALEHVTHSI